jgi:hypothetical protein
LPQNTYSEPAPLPSSAGGFHLHTLRGFRWIQLWNYQPQAQQSKQAGKGRHREQNDMAIPSRAYPFVVEDQCRSKCLDKQDLLRISTRWP